MKTFPLFVAVCLFASTLASDDTFQPTNAPQCCDFLFCPGDLYCEEQPGRWACRCRLSPERHRQRMLQAELVRQKSGHGGGQHHDSHDDEHNP